MCLGFEKLQSNLGERLLGLFQQVMKREEQEKDFALGFLLGKSGRVAPPQCVTHSLFFHYKLFLSLGKIGKRKKAKVEDDGVGLSFFHTIFLSLGKLERKEGEGGGRWGWPAFLLHRIVLSSGGSGREKRRIRGKMTQLVLSVTPCVFLEGWRSFFH